MRQKRDCPQPIADRITRAGGLNPQGEPMFRVVWGWNRMVGNHGQWPEMRVKLDAEREITLHTPIIETRMEPKYLPADCWHLEMWRPPEDYGTPETWGKLGQEIVGDMTIDTSGPFPHQGEWELCYPYTDNLEPTGKPLELEGKPLEMLVALILWGKREMLTQHQRESAIRQRELRERQKRVQETCDALLDARPSFYDQPTSYPTGPKIHLIQ